MACFAVLSCKKAGQNPTSTPIEDALADFEAKDFDAALGKLREIEKETPDDPFLLNLLGAAYTKKQDYPTAKIFFEKALAGDPNFFPAKFNVGELLFLQKQYPQALGFFTSMLRDAPGNELLQFKVVLSLIMTDQTEDAQKLAARMKYPGEGPAWYYAQAAVARKEDQASKASKYLSGAKTFFPDKIALYNETFEDLGWPTN